MKTLTALLVLFLLACRGEPVPPEEVAGVYDFHSREGEPVQLEEGDEVSLELRADGTIFSVYKVGDRQATASDAKFSVSRGKGGCNDFFGWHEDYPEARLTGLVCGDTLILVDDTRDRLMSYLKRH